MAGMGVTDIVNPILGAGRTMAMNNFQYINPINIYKKIQSAPNISEQFQIPTAITDSGIVKKIKKIFKDEPKEQIQTPITTRTVEGVNENVPAEEQPTPGAFEKPKTTGDIVFIVISSILAVGMLSFVINDMIMHPFTSRLIMTFVLITIFILNPFTPFVVLLYYLINAMWKYNLNSSVPENQRKRIIPYIYGFLPFTTTNPQTILGKIFLAPVRYDPDEDMENMKWDRKEWLKSILGSFPNAEATLAIGGMKSLYEKYTEYLGKIHEFDRVENVGDEQVVKRLNPFTASPKSKPEKQEEKKKDEEKESAQPSAVEVPAPPASPEEKPNTPDGVPSGR